MKSYMLKCGDCRTLLKELPDNSVDACITDPPYELTSGKKGGTGTASDNPNSPAGRARIGTGFMGKAWDATGIAFDPEMWSDVLRVVKPGGHLISFGGTRTYHRMACGIEDAGWDIRDSLHWFYGNGFPKSRNVAKALDGKFDRDTEQDNTAPYTPESDAAKQWNGWGTALKPCHEPAILARKPFDGTVESNMVKHGTGALNIDATRLPGGRWPTNIAFDSDAAYALDQQVAEASSFFYVAKASTAEREAGCETLPDVRRTDGRKTERHVPNLRTTNRRNHHPTVKPIDLMRQLVRMVTQPGGVVLDQFMGSGTTGIAATLENMKFIGFDLTPEYVEIADARIKYWQAEKEPSLFD